MAQPPERGDLKSLTVVARSVLLDALTALRDHEDSVVLVGAQAVYLHTTEADLGVPAYTSDGDLGIDPERIGPSPLLEQAMDAAGFSRTHDVREKQPGMWWKRAAVDGQPMLIEVDLMVPSELAPGSRRSVNVPPHDRGALRRVEGLAVAMEDNAFHTIRTLDPHDDRALDVRVAGVAALLVAKAIKIAERLGQPERRRTDKDASDVLRLMTVARSRDVAASFERLMVNDRVAEAAATGLVQLRRLFGTPRSAGVAMAERALEGRPAAARVRAVAPAFVQQLPQPPT